MKWINRLLMVQMLNAPRSEEKRSLQAEPSSTSSDRWISVQSSRICEKERKSFKYGSEVSAMMSSLVQGA